ncbi:ABC transporter ATP-binding protein [Solimicrobium silvestre]|uniref:ABC-type multidrug transport system ATPase component n=1 Tax=Solimicrobium silvestre TaxID=2099400 RepID=A0A2S9GYQ2_9BURK|nr:ABC transporter ATP-binding protein [Solimicrobium silvestre]PRC92841.1 ABC-type multidrug transport system ATPase component [Solimicrobium silvestre]
MNHPIIQLSNIVKSFDQHSVLRGLNWEVAPGSVIGLLGRNGAGKSTLLESALGLRDIDSGSNLLFGESVKHLSETTKEKIGYVPQQSDLFEWFTPRQMLAYFKSFYPRWNQEKVDGLMSRWAIPQDRLISKLSGGEKQRLSIIRALAHDPDLLILDEPVASLDPAGRRDFLRELINDVIQRETTVVFSTHILSDLERIAMTVAFLNDGVIKLQEPLDNLLENTVRIVTDNSKIASFSKILSRTEIDANQSSLLVQLTPQELLWSQKNFVNMEAIGLEDLFIDLTA